MKRDIHSLIQSWLNGDIDPADFERLQEQLRHSPEARQQLRHEINLDMVLRDHACASLDAKLTPWVSEIQPVRKPASTPVFRSWIPWAAAAGLAALITTGLALRTQNQNGSLLGGAKMEETNHGAAILTRVANATWADPNHSPRSGDTLSTGTFKLASGLAQIEFFSGATLLVDGPAEIEIHSPWKATCRSGKVRARVPPPAQGFVIHTPEMEVEDLGTEFGVEVDPIGHSTEVHVFEGEVRATPIGSQLVHLSEGQGLRRCSAGITPLKGNRSEDFICLERMDALTQNRAKTRFAAWKEWKKSYREDPRLLASYTFQRSCNWERAADNDAPKIASFCTGGIVGARWTQGRWPEKDALEFKRPGDRVRIRLAGEYEGLTFACWLKVDGLDRKYNALLLTDGYEHGEPHWQILEDGRVMFSIAAPPTPATQAPEVQAYYTPTVFTHSNLGRWHHLAVTYNAISGETAHYFDGREISRETPRQQPAGCTVVYGPCEIGNWGLPAAGHEFPIRNLNGCIDEFVIYKIPLNQSELQAIYQAGRQD
jgi:hypothetical protein